MADFIGTVGNAENKIVQRWVDEGDGTWALKVVTTPSTVLVPGSTDVTAKQGTGSSANPWFIANDSSHAITVAGNVSAAVSGNVSAAISGNATVFQGTSPWVISGNVTAAIAGSTDVTAKQGTPSSANPWFIQNDSSHLITIAGNVSAAVSGNVSAAISGNATVLQGTSPWTVGGNVSAAVAGNVTAAQGAPSSANPWFVQNDSSHALFITGTISASTDVTAKQGTPSSANPWFIQNDSSHAITVAGNVSAAVAGNVTAAQGTPSSANPWFIQNDSSHAITVAGNVTAIGNSTVFQGTSPWVVSGNVSAAIAGNATVAQGAGSSVSPWYVTNDNSHALLVKNNITDSTRVEVALLFTQVMTTTPALIQFNASTAFVQSSAFITDYSISSGRGLYVQSMDLNITAESSVAAGRSYYMALLVGYLTGATTLVAPGNVFTSTNAIWRFTLNVGGQLSVPELGNQYHVEFPQGVRIPAGSSASHIALVACQDPTFVLLSSVQFFGSLNGFEYF